MDKSKLSTSRLPTNLARGKLRVRVNRADDFVSAWDISFFSRDCDEARRRSNCVIRVTRRGESSEITRKPSGAWLSPYQFDKVNIIQFRFAKGFPNSILVIWIWAQLGKEKAEEWTRLISIKTSWRTWYNVIRCEISSINSQTNENGHLIDDLSNSREFLLKFKLFSTLI